MSSWSISIGTGKPRRAGKRARREATPRRRAGARVAFVERSPFLHRTVRSRVAATVAKLDCRHCAHFFYEVGDAAIGAHLMLIPDAGTVVGFAAACLDRGFLTEHDTGPAHGVTAEMHDLPVGGAAFD
jgi:hypothetical protein